MKARNPSTGQLETVYVKALDSMPVGTQVEFTGDTIPTGWEEVNDYSTTEMDTGKKWIDGKTIYRKVAYSNTAKTWSSRTSSITLDTISNVDTMIHFEVFGSTGGGTTSTLSLTQHHSWAGNSFNLNAANTFYTVFNHSNGNLSLNRQAGSSMDATTTLNRYVSICEYTKTS